MKIDEKQLIGNITTVEQQLLYLILLELRQKALAEPSHDETTLNEPLIHLEEKPSNTAKKRGTPRKKRNTAK